MQKYCPSTALGQCIFVHLYMHNSHYYKRLPGIRGTTFNVAIVIILNIITIRLKFDCSLDGVG